MTDTVGAGYDKSGERRRRPVARAKARRAQRPQGCRTRAGRSGRSVRRLSCTGTVSVACPALAKVKVTLTALRGTAVADPCSRAGRATPASRHRTADRFCSPKPDGRAGADGLRRTVGHRLRRRARRAARTGEQRRCRHDVPPAAERGAGHLDELVGALAVVHDVGRQRHRSAGGVRLSARAVERDVHDLDLADAAVGGVDGGLLVGGRGDLACSACGGQQGAAGGADSDQHGTESTHEQQRIWALHAAYAHPPCQLSGCSEPVEAVARLADCDRMCFCRKGLLD